MPDIFVSYSRRDKEFVQKLVSRLEADKRDVWVDFEDIPFASQWWDEICRGIEGSRAAVFVISPDSLASEVCGLEINYAIQNKKRLIPILLRDASDTPIPPDISHINWIFFNQPDIFEESLKKLLETVDTDYGLVERQTRLLMLAKNWEAKGHSNSLLLRGDQLSDFEALLANPDITDLQREFLLKSQEYQRRFDMVLRFGWGLLGGILGIGFWAFSTFRSVTLLNAQRVVYTIAIGQLFGVCLGLLSMLTDDLPIRWQRTWTSRPARLILRTLLFVGLGAFAWFSYSWCLESIGKTQQDYNALLMGGVGLAIGFLIRSLVKLRGWVMTLLMTLFFWLPIYIAFTDNYLHFVPLISFDKMPQVFTIGIPTALIMAAGANMQNLRADVHKLRLWLKNRQQPSKTVPTPPASLPDVEKT